MICDELRSDGFKPPTLVFMTLKKNYNGVAATGGNRITGSGKYFKSHPHGIRAMVHGTLHLVQRYPTGNNPGSLAEGVGGYLRFFQDQPALQLAPITAQP